MILPNDLRHLKPDAFHEGMDWPHAVGIIAALFVIAWAMNWIDERAEVKVNAAAQDTAQRAIPREEAVADRNRSGIPAAAAPLLAHPMPDCQWLSQWGPGEKPKPRCVNADLRGRK